MWLDVVGERERDTNEINHHHTKFPSASYHNRLLLQRGRPVQERRIQWMATLIPKTCEALSRSRLRFVWCFWTPITFPICDEKCWYIWTTTCNYTHLTTSTFLVSVSIHPTVSFSRISLEFIQHIFDKIALAENMQYLVRLQLLDFDVIAIDKAPISRPVRSMEMKLMNYMLHVSYRSVPRTWRYTMRKFETC